jgi:hypothetical protein
MFKTKASFQKDSPMRVEVIANEFMRERTARAKRPRLALVITPAGQPPRVGPALWLRTRYGVEQVQTINLTRVEWDGLAMDRENTHAAERLKDRLSLSLLGRPELLVVAGHRSFDKRWHSWQRSPRDVERIVGRISSWELPVEVVGAWLNERRDADERLVESEESGTRASGDRCPLWLAESAWENEGGRLRHGGAPAKTPHKHHMTRRIRHVVSDNHQHAAGYAERGEGQSPRRTHRALPRLRPDSSRLARA